MIDNKKKTGKIESPPKIVRNLPEAIDNAPMPKYMYPERAISEHLRPFHRLYNRLLKEKWFDKTRKSLLEENSVSKEQRDYALKVIDAIGFVRSLDRKQELFNALSTFLQYLSGELEDKREF